MHLSVRLKYCYLFIRSFCKLSMKLLADGPPDPRLVSAKELLSFVLHDCLAK